MVDIKSTVVLSKKNVVLLTLYELKEKAVGTDIQHRDMPWQLLLFKG